MPYLDKVLRRQLATTIGKAREVAEEGAAEALRRLAIAEDTAPAYLSTPDKALRRLLRAHARSLGDAWDGKTLGSTSHLMETAAFEHWHRMLFGRFLVERGLLVDPDSGATVAREELAELAAERGLSDEWALVEQIAAPALPAVFKPGDPALALPLAPEHAKRLRDLVAGLPADVFTSDDALGWTYQFWRAAEKDRVNKVGGKIGAAELPAVTQLFTEPYMVQFLLHNTLGAWWAGKALAADPALAMGATDEAALRRTLALPGVDWTYLRFVREDGGAWRPAAGGFPGWPARAAEVTMCDPCCGSGHFLTEALVILTALRGVEEGLDQAAAACAVLRDNLHGLEIDGRCVQIAAFNVAITAWGLAGGPVQLPSPHLAWVGAPPPMSRADMMALAEGDVELQAGLAALHDLFSEAPLLGALLEVTGGDLLDTARVAQLEERMNALVQRLRAVEPERAEGALAARGMTDAAAILARRYVLQVTNVPFLGRGKHSTVLATYTNWKMPEARADLATAMLQRMHSLGQSGGAIATVTPQNWLYLGSFKSFRRSLLRNSTLNFLVTLGEEAWEEFGQRGPKATLTVLTFTSPTTMAQHATLDASPIPSLVHKVAACHGAAITLISQRSQLANPDSVISSTVIEKGKLLKEYVDVRQGIITADIACFCHLFWEQIAINDRWSYCQLAPSNAPRDLGKSGLIRWEKGVGPLAKSGQARICGQPAWSKKGIAAAVTRSLARSDYDGTLFDCTIAAIVPKNPDDFPAIYACVMDDGYPDRVKALDVSLSVTESSFGKVSFDLAHWQAVAAERYPNGLPEPYSDDPTQWLFHGHPAHAEPGTELHVALARLAGYRWPAETDADMRLAPLARNHIALVAALPPVDPDGLLPLHPHGAGRSLADRLRDYLAAALGAPLTPARETELVAAADAKLDRKAARDATLDTWLRDRAFRQHCTLFHNRPFLWQVWDGLRDGFSAFLHYHRLDRALLERLAYTHLGDWIAHTRDAGQPVQREVAERLQRNLAHILQGEKPYDIFVRWKPLHRQPVGWAPDLDDGVRLNIRPFMEAKVLREQPRGIAWTKDRGTDVASAPWYHLGPEYGEAVGARINAHHLTLAEKQASRTLAAE